MFNNITSGTTGGTIAGTWYSNSHTTGGLSSIPFNGIDPYTSNTTTITTTATGNFTSYIPTHKKCRYCNHAHLNDQCIEFSDWGAVTFVKCDCKEYTPKDNLKYLEYLYDKKQRKESSPSL